MGKFAHQFVKTKGFEQTVAFETTLLTALWEAMQTKKNFRMVLEYDAEALNVSIDFEETGSPVAQTSTEEFLEKCKQELEKFSEDVVPKFLNRARALEAKNDKASKG